MFSKFFKYIILLRDAGVRDTFMHHLVQRETLNGEFISITRAWQNYNITVSASCICLKFMESGLCLLCIAVAPKKHYPEVKRKTSDVNTAMVKPRMVTNMSFLS